MTSKFTRVRLSVDVLVPTDEVSHALNSTGEFATFFPDYSVRVAQVELTALGDAQAVIECAEHGTQIGFFGFAVNAEAVDSALERAIASGASTDLRDAPVSQQVQYLASLGTAPHDILVEA